MKHVTEPKFDAIPSTQGQGEALTEHITPHVMGTATALQDTHNSQYTGTQPEAGPHGSVKLSCSQNILKQILLHTAASQSALSVVMTNPDVQFTWPSSLGMHKQKNVCQPPHTLEPCTLGYPCNSSILAHVTKTVPRTRRLLQDRCKTWT